MGLVSWFKDKSVVYSFDRTGFERHQAQFDPADVDLDLTGKTYLVTGANSGLGLALCHNLAARNATVKMLCRNETRGLAAAEAVMTENQNPNVEFIPLDLASFDSVRACAQRLAETPIDALIHNAGLLPQQRSLAEGYELTVTVHVLAPYLLTRLLESQFRTTRMIWVSSGGMYAKRFNLKTMLRTTGKYDGVAAYAMTKRAQVILSRELAKRYDPSECTVQSMHPGWAATPGVESSLPGFWKRMEHRLRTPEQGADTVLFLALAPKLAGDTGQFWFDRQPVTEYMVPGTQESKDQVRALLELCEAVLDR